MQNILQGAVHIARVCAVLAWSSSCISGGGRPHDAETGAGATGAANLDFTYYEAKLKKLAKQDFESVQRSQKEHRSKIVHRKPYYFKEYADYPAGADSFSLTFHEKESRMVPYAAELTIAKVRYSTKFHKKRRDAEADMQFSRDVGTETVGYQLRAGKWRRVGSVFVSSAREEPVSDEGQSAEGSRSSVSP